MFLLTFVLIIISVLGAYTQVSALAAARFMANQTSLAQTLVIWHSSAASIAANVVNPASAGVTGCSLTPKTNNMCAVGNGFYNIGTTSTAVATGAFQNIATGMVFPNTPPNIGANIFQWNSVAFTPPGGGYYVVTYVTPAAGAGGFVSTATNPPTQLNVTESDIFRQLRLMGLPTYSFGYVSNPTGASATLNATPLNFVIGGVPTLRAMNYTVPSSIPNNSLGIISSPGQCSGC